MTVTKLSIVAGFVVVGLLCALAAIGFTAMVAPLVTVVVLLVLIAGGNLLGGGRH